MDAATAQQALTELARVSTTLIKTRRFFMAVDVARAALDDEPEPRPSALYTQTELAVAQAELVENMLREATQSGRGGS